MDTAVLLVLLAAQIFNTMLLVRIAERTRQSGRILFDEAERSKAEREKHRQDAVCWEAMQQQADAEEKDPDPSKRIDEGFENLMTYEVHLGRGKKTGGEP